ncbi:alcohol dehydrogenase [Phlyctema vagabunda]|uniref:Alcohol dehydrogenase n=1 Tax=Phlyctema vagabunda TaxID=108571 RepID=A0ABR4PIE6_9HELO
MHVDSHSAVAASEAVADFAIFLILATFRNLNWCTTSARSTPADFKDCHTHAPVISHNPRRHTLGVIGLGAIGFLIAQKAYLAFGMKIVYFDILRKSPGAEASIDATFYPDMDSMLGACDCVVLATPASPDGRKAIDAARLKCFKPGSRFVNIARGVLVDEEALADALDQGRLVGVGLDVHENEPNVNERLKAMRNVTLTTHNAGGTLETHIGFEALSLANIDAVLKGKDPLSAVNKHLIP